MKKINLALTSMILFAAVAISYAQDGEMKYIFSGKDKVKISGFIAPIMEYSAIGNDFAFFMGGGGAILFNQTFFFGGYGEGLTTQYLTKIKFNENSVNREVEFGHGGLWAGYILLSRLPIHAGISSKFGWGTIQPWNDDYKPNFSSDFTDHVFVMIPQIEVEFNFLKWFKMNIGTGFRFVTVVDKEYPGTDELIYDKKDFNKPQATMTLMFGFFK